MVKKTIFTTLSSLLLAAQPPLSLADAYAAAFRNQAGLKAGQALADRAAAEAEALHRLRYPTASLGVAFLRTDEPMMAFGSKLNQARITPMDFNPASLNRPEAVQGTGASLSIAQPLYAGGRLDAAQRAGAAMAQAEAATQASRRQQVALAITQAYFGAQLAEKAAVWAEDTLRQAQETERFVQARVDQGLMLPSEGRRAAAFRAQAEAGLAEARQRIGSARSALGLLTGTDATAVSLTTPVNPAASTIPEGRRPDLIAARAQAQAAREGVVASQGQLKPEVGLQLQTGTLRQSWGQGGSWTAATLGAKWTFSFSDSARVSAARAAARAAEQAVAWQEAQARREVDEARRQIATAQSRIASAQAAVEASEAVRAMRTARHREGLLPLVEVLDAESALSGARTLLLNAQMDLRLGHAALALALGHPLEAIQE